MRAIGRILGVAASGAGTAVIGQRGEVPAAAEPRRPYFGLAIGYAVSPW